MLDELLLAFHRHERRALSRLLSYLARGEQVDAIRERLPAPAHLARVVAVTGSAGVGKSTLVGKLIEVIRAQRLSVAVLACDPQSPLSGGALLGDRFRMPTHPEDEGVFIRSLATPGGQGAVAQHIEPMIRLLEAFGFDVVLLETVGAGQGDTVVHELADVVVLLLQPEAGDDLQWEKAGVLEVADVVVIHKADLPGADRVENQVCQAMELASRPARVVRVSSRTGEGLDALWQAIADCPLRRQRPRGPAHDRPRLAAAVLDQLLHRLPLKEAKSVLVEYENESLSFDEAARRLLDLMKPAHPDMANDAREKRHVS